MSETFGEQVIKIIRKEYENALHVFITAKAELSAKQASYSVWEDYNNDEDVIGFGRKNPYDVVTATKRLREADMEMQRLKTVYEYAISTFLKKLDGEE